MGKKRRYRGVKKRQWGSWVSEIRYPILQKRAWLGTYQTAEEAAYAYDDAATIVYGDHAKTNFGNNGKADCNSEQRRVLSTAIIEKLHNLNVASMALHYNYGSKNIRGDSASSLCLKLDTGNSNELGILQNKTNGVKGDSSKWVIKVKIPAIKADDIEREEDIISEMIEELLLPCSATENCNIP